MTPTKTYKLDAADIQRLVPPMGACLATDMITVDGLPVGFMFREHPDNDLDSGWRFTAGRESQAYMDEPGNHGLHAPNTIANYDRDIIPLLDAPVGSAFERSGGTGGFVQVHDFFPPGYVEGGVDQERGGAVGTRWPPPGFPLVEGVHQLTERWTIQLPEPFARRIDEGHLVLWRPGVTLWLSVWGNDEGHAQAERLGWLREDLDASAFDQQESVDDDVTRFGYRLRELGDDGPVESLYTLILYDEGHLEAAIYFDGPEHEPTARALAASIAQAGPTSRH
jgi:hypothetical protein